VSDQPRRQHVATAREDIAADVMDSHNDELAASNCGAQAAVAGINTLGC
jgi:hypothetical protein